MATVHGGDHTRMQRTVIAFEALAFAAIALVPQMAPDLLVNSLISLCAAVSFENFRTFGTRSAYASIFCTGNLRSFAETLYDGVVGGDAEEVQRSLRYLALVVSFAFGVMMGFGLVSALGSYAALGVSALFLVANHFVGE